MDDEQFLKIIDSTPLVSIDFIIENSDGEILLGERLNRPAQGYWFVPGGRIRKNEKIKDAFKRISSIELGSELSISDAQLLGAFDHIYDDNYLGAEKVNTHYVVLGYKIKLQENLIIKPDGQHSKIKWWNPHDLLNDSDVHPNTKAYFTNK